MLKILVHLPITHLFKKFRYYNKHIQQSHWPLRFSVVCFGRQRAFPSNSFIGAQQFSRQVRNNTVTQAVYLTSSSASVRHTGHISPSRAFNSFMKHLPTRVQHQFSTCAWSHSDHICTVPSIIQMCDLHTGDPIDVNAMPVSYKKFYVYGDAEVTVLMGILLKYWMSAALRFTVFC